MRPRDGSGQPPGGTPNKFKRPLKDWKREGHIGFQNHGAGVSYRNLRLKALPYGKTHADALGFLMFRFQIATGGAQGLDDFVERYKMRAKAGQRAAGRDVPAP